MRQIIEAAREVAREVEQSINPGNVIDAEVKSVLAASWLTFAELIERGVQAENLAAILRESTQPLAAE